MIKSKKWIIESNYLFLRGVTCINTMLQSKYNKYRFYCHNFGNYDVYFIFNSLSLDDFKNMYLKNKDVKALKTHTI